MAPTSDAPSSNGKRADSDSVNQGSNPCGASIFPDLQRAHVSMAEAITFATVSMSAAVMQ